MRDLDVDDRILEEEEELDPTHSRVDELDAQEEEEEGFDEERQLETDHEVQVQGREVDLEEEADRETGQDPEHEVVPEVVRESAARDHYRRVVGRIGALLRGDELDLELERGMPDLGHEELVALQLLQEVVTGKDRLTHRIVYAERRLAMLEVAIATLQPTLALAFVPELEDLRTSYDDLVVEVGELRHQLDQLDAVQEEILGEREVEQAAEKPEGEEKPDEEGVEKPSTLFGKPGEPAVEDKPAPSTLAGKPGEPAVEDKPAPSTLAGKPNEPAVEKPVTKSTVYEP